jgi:hypothetical protein
MMRAICGAGGQSFLWFGCVTPVREGGARKTKQGRRIDCERDTREASGIKRPIMSWMGEMMTGLDEQY